MRGCQTVRCAWESKDTTELVVKLGPGDLVACQRRLQLEHDTQLREIFKVCA